MRRSTAAAMVLTALGVSATAYAEPPVGSRLGADRKVAAQVSTAETLNDAHRIAECVAHKRPSAVRIYLGAVTEEELRRAARGMSQGVECMNLATSSDFGEQAMYQSTDMRRGMLAEAMLKEAHPVIAQAPAEKSYARPWFAMTGRAPSIDEMAMCVSDADPADVMMVFSANPLSSQENAAFGRLGPALGHCLVAGTKLTASADGLRAALADALYHRWMESR